jgi:hypothetical protein
MKKYVIEKKFTILIRKTVEDYDEDVLIEIALDISLLQLMMLFYSKKFTHALVVEMLLQQPK